MSRPPKKFGRKPPHRRVKPRRFAPTARTQPVHTPEDQPRDERLQKVLAAAGIASRRECEQLITEGRVEVDGQVVSELGKRVDRQRQEIRVDGEPLPRPRLQYFAVHKPAGVVSTARDPAGRPRVIDLLPPGVGRMFNVGRLDLASEGLIIVTNDGELANQLTHPRHGVEKIYEVQVAGHPEPDVLAQVKRGVHLAEGFVHAVDVRVKDRKKGSTLLEMVLDEGRNREIRRLLARLGHKVQRLTRIAVGPIRLGVMPRGAVRPLTREEVQKLRAAADLRRPRENNATPSSSRTTAASRPRQKPRMHVPKRRVAPAVKKQSATHQIEGRRIIGDDAPPADADRPKFKRKPHKRGGPPGKRPGRGPKRSDRP